MDLRSRSAALLSALASTDAPGVSDGTEAGPYTSAPSTSVPIAPTAPAQVPPHKGIDIHYNPSFIPATDPALVKAMGKPPTFTGAGVTHADILRWLFLIGNFIALFTLSELQMIQLATSYLGGAALNWYINRVRTQQAFTTFGEFQEELLAAFVPFNQDVRARDALKLLTQTTSVIAYTNAFREAAMLVSNLSPAEMLDRYIDGLKPRVRLELRLRLPSTFAEAASLAVRIDTSNPPPNPNPHPAPPTNPRPNNPRLHAAAANAPHPLAKAPGPRAPITPEQRQYLNDNGGCTYCRQLGHTIGDCPSPSRRPKGPGAQ